MTLNSNEIHVPKVRTRRHAVMWHAVILLGLIALAGPQTVHGAEGAVDYYMQGGVYGNFQMAKLPGPGLYALNYMIYQNGEADAAVRGGAYPCGHRRRHRRLCPWAGVYL